MKALFFVIVGLVLVVFGNVVSAKTIYVREGNRSSRSSRGVSWADAYGNLQSALNDAENGDGIWVAAGTYKPSAKVGGAGDRYKTFQMKNGVGIYGGFNGTETALGQRDAQNNETTLSGDLNGDDGPDFANNSENCYHVFYNSNLDATAVLDGFTVTGGNTDMFGGGMYNDGGNPTVTNCTFSGNSGGVGGGMSNFMSSPTVTNCTFSGNSAVHAGGGMCNVEGDPTVTNCTFSGNSAGTGGGMENGGGSSSTVTDCTFIGNSAAYQGGGMSNQENWDSGLTVTNCIFSGNSAGRDGGGIYNMFSYPTLTNCTFSGNSAKDGGGMYNIGGDDVTVINCTFNSNLADYSGGGMHNEMSSPAVTDCTFSDNSADKGGGIYSWVNSNPTVSNCTFSGNSANEGGGTYIEWDSSSTVTNSTFSGNSAVESGGGAYNNGCDPTFMGCIFSGNSANEGGGMYNNGNRPTVTDCHFSENLADFGSGMYNESSSPAVTNCTFSGNQADVIGGGMFNLMSSPTVTNCTFSGNTAIIDGGGMWNLAIKVTVIDCTFIGNSAGSDGGGIWSVSDDVVIRCTFSSNTAGNGGGMWNEMSSPTVSDCTFSDNSASDKGGGIYGRENSNPTVSNCIFSGNSANEGGGMYNIEGWSWTGGNPTVTDCTFSSNSAVESGGGVYNFQFNSTFSGCTFSDNSADTGDGGGVYMYGSDSTLTNCTFTVNSSAYGGGGIFYGGNCNFTAINCNFSGNSAGYGGGIHAQNNGISLVAGCNFSNNEATSVDGGGIWIVSSGNMTIKDSTFSGNRADDHGGGISNDSVADVIVDNCTFTVNSANYWGGGIHNTSSPTVNNCTFVGNFADFGGVMANISCGSVMTNCILRDNTAVHGGDEIALLFTASLDIDYCDVMGGQAGIYDDPGSIINWGSGNIDADPLFVDPNGVDGVIGTDDDNLRLMAGSPCIDAGDNGAVPAGVITDLDGRIRIADGDGDGTATVDMGAYEFFNSAPVAGAGDDVVVYAVADGTAIVKLDGSRSFDADGDALNCFWYEGGERIAAGIDPNVIFTIGEHVIDLVVNDGNLNSEPDSVIVTVLEMPNSAPVANAGNDIIAFAGHEGTATVKLDGSGSVDADGDELEYFWFNDANELIAEGVDPNVVFAAGVYVIELVVDDGTVSSEPNSVVVTVVEAVEAVAYVFPRVLNVGSRGRYVIARMQLPDGISKDDVADDSLVLMIGDAVIESVRQRRISSRGQDYVFGFFDRGRVIAQAVGKPKLDIIIASKLVTGQCVYGEDSIKIVKSQASQTKTLRRMPARNNRGRR